VGYQNICFCTFWTQFYGHLLIIYNFDYFYLLFPSENVLIEVILDLLVRNIDAQLLEGVFREVLKAENVQQPNRQRFFATKQIKNNLISSQLPN